MIHEVDESLLALIRRDALKGKKAEVVFDAPTKEWVASHPGPIVDLYLYDIREDLARREVTWEDVRDETGRVTDRRPPPRRFKLSYLVTAWTKWPKDEHLLLADLLSCFVRHESMPLDLLTGSLADQPRLVYLTVAQPPTADRSLADIWSALGGELKPSLDLAIVAPVTVDRIETAGPPVRETPRFEFLRPDGGDEETSVARRGGGRGGRARSGRPLTPSEPADREESFTAGTEAQPGRRFRARGMDR